MTPPRRSSLGIGHEQLSNSFGTDLRPDSVSIISGKTDAYSGRPSMDPGRAPLSAYPAPPPVPTSPWDPYARTESMTHRGRYSYASSAISTINSPRRVRRRKDPTPFNERVGLTLWDSEGLEKNVVDLQLREMSAFLESKFEETFAEEMKVVRSPGVQDTHIHAVFLVLDPSRLDRNLSTAKSIYANGHNGIADLRALGALDDDLDLQVMRTLQGKTTVIPVIAKADTITTKHMAALKRSVWSSIKKANLDPLESLALEDDDAASSSSSRIDEGDEDAAQADARSDVIRGDSDLPIQGQEDLDAGAESNPSALRQRSEKGPAEEEESSFLPLSIISPDLYEPGVIGRQFPWGFADPYNEEHCDFTRLKDTVFSEWRAELREASREQWYEGWRTSRLKVRDGPTRRRI
ncbi:unnamed protein product [Parascedosporium putredinis]|uniref:Septin-type G domain-containing protein n=1 Tax=Parascedosporium putredinis TaxID=1442378 RepID=A0A9P1GUJ3_9PEZI|nr:unnamed protein product [Parascedosporium putredinis]CAI7987907.1 unnamed protein product [Parascedosporium putredinis]